MDSPSFFRPLILLRDCVVGFRSPWIPAAIFKTYAYPGPRAYREQKVMDQVCWNMFRFGSILRHAIVEFDDLTMVDKKTDIKLNLGYTHGRESTR